MVTGAVTTKLLNTLAAVGLTGLGVDRKHASDGEGITSIERSVSGCSSDRDGRG
jgi:hypothetical protein